MKVCNNWYKTCVPVVTWSNKDDRRSHSNLPKVTITDYNVMTDCKNVFDQPINIDIKTFENIRKFATGQGDDYTIGGLLDYPYFKNKIIAVEFK